jgi:hypothetical protein
MRIVLSEGPVNIFNLAKNAGTSAEQIERFYARDLPLSEEMAKNLHTLAIGIPSTQCGLQSLGLIFGGTRICA